MMRAKNVYLHFPYCEAKCHYCDFFSLPESQHSKSVRHDAYSAVNAELAMHQPALDDILSTVFMGGGTPSLVPLEFMAQVSEKLRLREQKKLNPDFEWTLEANPSSITSEKANMWISLGANRVSMGVQALEDERLKWLGRVHDKSSIFSALEILFGAGFQNVSIDYILGVPNQSTAQIQSELGEILDAFPQIQHLSAYLLTLKTSNSKFRELPDEDIQLAHLRTAKYFLESRGFEHYEISNFCRPGKRALHNENYWLGGAYAGIGPSAHSYWPEKLSRTKNWASLGKYIELVGARKLPVEWEESLTSEQLRMEYLMTRLRRADGLDIQDYNDRFGVDLLKSRKQALDSLTEKQHCEVNNFVRLKNDGFFLSDQVLGMLV